MLNLSSHCRSVSSLFILLSTAVLTRQRKQYDPIHDQDRPENRQVEYSEPTAHKANHHRPRSSMPELELGQPSDEWPELLILFCRQT